MSLETVDSRNSNACHHRNDEHAKAGGQERRPAHTLAVGLCGARRPLDRSAALGGMRGGSSDIGKSVCAPESASVPARERGGRSTRCLSALASRVSLRVCRKCHFNNKNQDSRYSNRCVSNRRVGRHAALVVGTQRVRFRVRARVVRRAPLGVVVVSRPPRRVVRALGVLRACGARQQGVGWVCIYRGPLLCHAPLPSLRRHTQHRSPSGSAT